MNLDGFKYMFNNFWTSRHDGDGLRYSYNCRDSLQNKDRHAHVPARASTVPPVHREMLRRTKESWDCKGAISIKFSPAIRAIVVQYRHAAIHPTIEDRRRPPRKPSAPRSSRPPGRPRGSRGTKRPGGCVLGSGRVRVVVVLYRADHFDCCCSLALRLTGEEVRSLSCYVRHCCCCVQSLRWDQTRWLEPHRSPRALGVVDADKHVKQAPASSMSTGLDCPASIHTCTRVTPTTDNSQQQTSHVFSSESSRPSSLATFAQLSPQLCICRNSSNGSRTQQEDHQHRRLSNHWR
jgi:hypothetical protein